MTSGKGIAILTKKSASLWAFVKQWRTKGLIAVNTRLDALEQTLLSVRAAVELLEHRTAQRPPDLTAEFAALHAKLDAQQAQPMPVQPPPVPLSTTAAPALFDELPDNDPRGLTSAERVLSARYQEPA